MIRRKEIVSTLRRRVTDRPAPFQEYAIAEDWPNGGTVVVGVWVRAEPTETQRAVMAAACAQVAQAFGAPA